MSPVRFWIEVVVDGAVVRLEEDDLPGLSDAQRAAMTDQIDAAVVIDGQPPLEVTDDLTALAHWLCFAGPKAMLDDPYGCFLYRSTQATLHTVMIPLATLVRVFGEQTPVITGELDELLPELYRCGRRIIDLLERVGDPSEAAFTAADLRAAADRLHEALAARGIVV